MNDIQLFNGDCLEVMKRIPDHSVDMVLCDLPYMETGNKWDKSFPVSAVCKEYRRVIKDTGAIALTGSFRFGALLFNEMEDLYKYDWIWEKDNGTNAPNVNYQPFRIHEHIFIFGKGRVTNGKRVKMTYNPQKTNGKPYSQKSGKPSKNWKGGIGQVVTNNESGLRYPKSIQKFNRDKSRLHPTQKPVALLEYLIKTYTNEGELVLDNTMGSGSTMVACVKTKRRGIGIELDKGYYKIACERVDKAIEEKESSLF